MTRAAVYLRISLDQTGEEKAVARQHEDALALIKARKWKLHAVYQDNSKSSKKSVKRPEYNRLVDDYKAGLFSAVVCYDLDRFTRQLSQLEDWIEESETKGLIIVTLNGEADLATDAGRLFARIKVAVARSEVERMGARRKRSNVQTISEGKPAPGRRPFGWELGGVTLRPEEARVVRVAYRYVRIGGSMRRLVRHWNAKEIPSPQGTPWTAFKVRQLLDRKRNFGVLERYGVEQPISLIEPIIDRDTFDQVQAIIGERAQPGRKPEKHLISGLATCGTCQRPLGAKALKSGKAREREPYYMCSSKINRHEHPDGKRHPTIRAHLLEKRVEEEIAAAFLFGSSDLFPDRDNGNLGELHVKLKNIRDGIQRLVRTVSDGHIDDGEASAEFARLHREEAALVAAIEEANARSASSRFADIRGDIMKPGPVDLDRTAEVKEALRENFRALDFEAKRRLIRALLSIEVATGYGAKRAHITHKVVTILNDAQEAA